MSKGVPIGWMLPKQKAPPKLLTWASLNSLGVQKEQGDDICHLVYGLPVN